ncbi:OLC1v1002278C1 [Oldenlandia corymbosa var. corymbosa]|uniref:OLC1v1002278C1 n=1 Tax=Oldenlandia corymbosa var. corymbosa TaxID=529605 RepID=A0AAV1D9L6_OLDCO|nr:OLC1v1002278C1 [Oldenlandia corymbosa var. corymbosa]
MMMRQEGSGGGGASSSSSSSRCQDCGNQAKKDCSYFRCRTCCKTRGFQCPTHVKSTWVPVSKRRPRHPIPLYPPEPKPKRSRDTACSIEGNFPAEVSVPAVFRCVRVSSMDNVVDQFAYQASVNIAGHVFKGVLYDQGPPPHDQNFHHHFGHVGDTSCGGGVEGGVGGGGGGSGFHQLQPSSNLMAGASTASTSTAASPHSGYPSPFSAFMPPTTHIFQYSKS